MNVYDLAHNLAKGLKNCPEYQKYHEALTKIKGNTEKEKILTDIRRKQMELQSMQMMGQDIPEEKKKELEKSMEIINLHPSIKEFLEAEYQLGMVIGDIYKILGDAVEMWQPDFS